MTRETGSGAVLVSRVVDVSGVPLRNLDGGVLPITTGVSVAAFQSALMPVPVAAFSSSV
jgi:hypothetical protein